MSTSKNPTASRKWPHPLHNLQSCQTCYSISCSLSTHCRPCSISIPSSYFLFLHSGRLAWLQCTFNCRCLSYEILQSFLRLSMAILCLSMAHYLVDPLCLCQVRCLVLILSRKRVNRNNSILYTPLSV